MWNLICQNRAELIMALLPYLFVPIHTVKVCPMLLKIGHVMETYGTGKLEAGLLEQAIGLDAKYRGGSTIVVGSTMNN
jgi:hypothetical protein